MNTKRIYLLLVISFLIEEDIFSQKQTTHLQQVWMGYFNQTRFSDKWGIWAEAQLRTKEDFFSNFSQSILRAGATYYFNNNTKLTAGYAYVSIYPGDNHKNVTQPEHRIWQQLQWHSNYSRLRLMQWFRLEERYRRKIKNDDELADGYNFNYRIRYNFLMMVPLGKKAYAPGSLSFVANDEVHVNFGKEIVYNYFDQNRFFLGLAWHTSASNNLQLGYMNVFQQMAAGNQYKSINGARVSYFHNIDLRKK